jgi:hypothetical protein
MPESAKGWLRWSCYVLESQSRPFSPRYDGIPRTDSRCRESRETALSVKMILEKVTNGNGAGKLLVDFYVNEISFYDFTPSEQWILEKTGQASAMALREAGFLPERG